MPPKGRGAVRGERAHRNPPTTLVGASGYGKSWLKPPLPKAASLQARAVGHKPDPSQVRPPVSSCLNYLHGLSHVHAL
ncbi:hypothetical protein BX600DRAFT_29289 [Xylariales sp. PMI_506]|nr:hypothetical protein BX600DRAFT_29289 [Xylariales sp. PMI_506]